MREPGFWYRPASFQSHLLRPLGALYGAVAARRLQRAGVDAGIPVLCVGNYHGGGAGNGRVIPAGPLRAPLAAQLDRTDALVVIGSGSGADSVAGSIAGAGKPVLRARFLADDASLAALRGKRALAFAGIGDPVRFFTTLAGSGIEVVR